MTTTTTGTDRTEWETYSWTGTDRRRVAHAGRTGYTLAQIARVTET